LDKPANKVCHPSGIDQAADHLINGIPGNIKQAELFKVIP